jgi:hypothetical protein
VVSRATAVQERVGSRAEGLTAARAVLDAEATLLEEEEVWGRDRFSRGGRRPTARVLTADEVATMHEVVRRQRGSAERLKELLAEGNADEDVDD